jgi:hypothetical protein
MDCPERDRLIRAHDEAERLYAEIRGQVRDSKFGDGAGDHQRLLSKREEIQAELNAVEMELKAHLDRHRCS